MKNWAFVSDFDGTISEVDFYSLVIEKYFPDGRELFKRWKAEEILDIDFLQKIFLSINQDEEQIINEITSMPIDDYVPNFIKAVQKNGGDFYILSAGTDYYIHHFLKKHHIQDVKVFSNEGYFHEKNIHLNIDKKHEHFSKRYGINKSKVITQLKDQYDFVYFIGDSEPDSHPAKHADITFAKGALQHILKEQNTPFIPVNTFKEVEQFFIDKGVIQSC